MHHEFHIETTDNLKLYGRYWSGSDPRAVICLVHGMGEHSGRYEHVAEFFNRHNIAFLAIDLRGHGRSEGKKGHTPGLEHLLNDIDGMLWHANQFFHNKSKILYGHSLGGNLAINYAIRRKPVLSGLIATAPYLTLAFEPPAWKVKLAKVSAGILPGLTQPTGLDTLALSRDPEVVKNYNQDPMVHDKMSAGFFVNVHFAGPYAIEHASELNIPTLLMHGNADRITSVGSTREFAEKIGSLGEYKEWEGLFHEVHNEPEKEEVLNHMLGWINRIIPA